MTAPTINGLPPSAQDIADFKAAFQITEGGGGGTTPTEVNALIAAQKNAAGGIAGFDATQSALADRATLAQVSTAANNAVNAQKGAPGGVAAFDATAIALATKSTPADVAAQVKTLKQGIRTKWNCFSPWTGGGNTSNSRSNATNALFQASFTLPYLATAFEGILQNASLTDAWSLKMWIAPMTDLSGNIPSANWIPITSGGSTSLVVPAAVAQTTSFDKAAGRYQGQLKLDRLVLTPVPFGSALTSSRWAVRTWDSSGLKTEVLPVPTQSVQSLLGVDFRSGNSGSNILDANTLTTNIAMGDVGGSIPNMYLNFFTDSNVSSAKVMLVAASQLGDSGMSARLWNNLQALVPGVGTDNFAYPNRGLEWQGYEMRRAIDLNNYDIVFCYADSINSQDTTAGLVTQVDKVIADCQYAATKGVKVIAAVRWDYPQARRDIFQRLSKFATVVDIPREIVDPVTNSLTAAYGETGAGSVHANEAARDIFVPQYAAAIASLIR